MTSSENGLSGLREQGAARRKLYPYLAHGVQQRRCALFQLPHWNAEGGSGDRDGGHWATLRVQDGCGYGPHPLLVLPIHARPPLLAGGFEFIAEHARIGDGSRRLGLEGHPLYEVLTLVFGQEGKDRFALGEAMERDAGADVVVDLDATRAHHLF